MAAYAACYPVAYPGLPFSRRLDVRRNRRRRHRTRAKRGTEQGAGRSGHRTGDVLQAALAGLGPALFGFAGDEEAKFFYAQAASEVAVIAATDWDAA